jgi:peptide/nickel transport system ATP-binding protein
LPTGNGRSALDIEELLERIRSGDPAEPLWRGVADIRPVGEAVTVDFRDDFVDPPLYDVGDVKVACLKYRGDSAV